MAQFVALNKDVEVNKRTLLSIVNSMDQGRENRINILEKNGINLDSKEWFNQQDWLNAFKDISNTLGEMNLYLIGKAIIKSAEFPPIKDLEEGLKSINIAYHMNHRLSGKVMFDKITGKTIDGIGSYKLVEYSAENRTAVMVCNNPYPSKFDEGIIIQVVRTYKPKGSIEKIQLDLTKESRKNGAKSCTYIITW